MEEDQVSQLPSRSHHQTHDIVTPPGNGGDKQFNRASELST